jgi:hypothetical protein
MDPYAAKPAQSFALNGRTDAEIRAWLGGEMSSRGFNAAALDAPSPYEMPAHAIATGARYLTRGLEGELGQLGLWYGNAQGMLSLMRKDLVGRKLSPPPVRCWPHHFDLDTLVTFGAGEGARSMGAGFSPGDHYYDEPYFYISLYPGPDIAKLPPLPALGHWHNKDFTAAVVPAHQIVAAMDQRSEVERVLRAAIDTAIDVLA